MTGQQSVGMPVRLIRGNASPEELAALIAILATTGGEDGPDPTDGAAPASVNRRKLPWGSPGRMVRRTPPHGPGGWRASALPR